MLGNRILFSLLLRGSSTFNAVRILSGIILISATIIHALIATELWLERDRPIVTLGQQLLYHYISQEMWVFAFAMCSFTAALGIWYIVSAQIHFCIAGTLMLAWAAIALQVPGSILISIGGALLFHMAVLKFACAYYAPKVFKAQHAAQKILAEVDLAEKVLSSEDYVSGKQ